MNLQIRAGNEGVVAFYDRLGYAPDEATGLGKRLIPDGPDRAATPGDRSDGPR